MTTRKKTPLAEMPAPAGSGFASLQEYDDHQRDYARRARDRFGDIEVGARVKDRFVDSWGTVIDVHRPHGTFVTGVRVALDTPFTDPMGGYHTYVDKYLATLDVDADPADDPRSSEHQRARALVVEDVRQGYPDLTADEAIAHVRDTLCLPGTPYARTTETVEDDGTALSRAYIAVLRSDPRR